MLLLAKLLEVSPPDMFLVFFKLYKWYQIIKKCLIFIEFLLLSFLNFELYVSIGSAKSNHSRFCRFIAINFGNNCLSLNHCRLHLTNQLVAINAFYVNLKILGGLIVELLLNDKFSLILGQFFH